MTTTSDPRVVRRIVAEYHARFVRPAWSDFQDAAIVYLKTRSPDDGAAMADAMDSVTSVLKIFEDFIQGSLVLPG